MDYTFRFERTSGTEITCVAGSRSKEYITGARDGTLRIQTLTAPDGGGQSRVAEHESPVEALAATDTLAASADSDGTVAVWEPASLANYATTCCHSAPVRALDISGDNTSVVSGGFDTDLVFSPAPDWTPPDHRWTLGWKIVTCSVHPAQSLVAVGGVHSSVQVVGLSARDDVVRLGGHETAVVGVAFAPAGDHLVTVDYTGDVRIWSVDSWTLQTLVTLEPSGDYPLAVSEERIYIGTDDGIHVCDFDGTATGHIETAVGIADIALVDTTSLVAIPHTGSELVYTRLT